jgi:multidrug efflux pump subunit AcrB
LNGDRVEVTSGLSPRDAIVVTLVMLLGLLYALCNSWRQALIVMATLPFGAIGGVLFLLIPIFASF